MANAFLSRSLAGHSELQDCLAIFTAYEVTGVVTLGAPDWRLAGLEALKPRIASEQGWP
jgi:hypothetical protein